MGWLFIGIESANPQTLKTTRKSQNLREDVLTCVHRIYTQGIDVHAGFIFGFEQDTPKTFEHQFRFIMDSGKQAATVGLHTAVPRTPFYERLNPEGHLIESAPGVDNTRPTTHVMPKNMSSATRVAAYEAW